MDKYLTSSVPKNNFPNRTDKAVSWKYSEHWINEGGKERAEHLNPQAYCLEKLQHIL